jgi:hypothetical protein
VDKSFKIIFFVTGVLVFSILASTLKVAASDTAFAAQLPCADSMRVVDIEIAIYRGVVRGISESTLSEKQKARVDFTKAIGTNLQKEMNRLRSGKVEEKIQVIEGALVRCASASFSDEEMEYIDFEIDSTLKRLARFDTKN